MKKTKRRLELYSFYDHTGLEKHLEKMAGKGWLLEKVWNNVWYYRRIAPRELKFSVTYFPKVSELDPEPSEKQQMFLDFCEHTGWKLAAVTTQMQIFYNENPNPVPIETDPRLELETLRRTARRSVLLPCFILGALGLMNTILLIHTLRTDPIGLLSSGSGLLGAWCWLMILLLSAVELGGYFRWYRKAEKAAARGEFLETANHVWLTKLILASIILMFLYWLAGWISTGPYWKRILGVVISGYMIGVLFFSGIFKGCLKRRKASAGMNITLTMLLVFAVTILFLTGVTWAGLRMAQDARQAEQEGRTEASMHGYLAAPPLALSDLTDISASDYIQSSTGEESLLLEQFELQAFPKNGAEDRGELPQMNYRVTLVKVPFLYDICRDQLFRDRDETGDAEIPEGHKAVYEARDPEPWRAREVYELTYQDESGFSNQYLLCYPDRIVEIGFSWELTEEQMRIVGEKLA